MVAAIAKTTTNLAKMLMGCKIPQVLLTSTRGMLSQAKLVDTHEEIHEAKSGEHKQEVLSSEETYRIHLHAANGSLKVNLEDISNNMQRELIDHLGPVLKATTEEEEILNVSINYLAEEVFVNNLNRAFRKLGYKGCFTRYSNDRGLATFTMLEDDEEGVMKTYSYFKSGHPNLC